MGPAAYVTETAALAEFRAKLAGFAAQAKDAMIIADHEIRRTLAFIDERITEWHGAARQAEDDVIQAKIELMQRRNQRIGDSKPDTTYQEQVLRRAQARLEYAQDKLAAAKRWQRDLPHEVTTYQGPARQLQNALESDVPRMMAFLDEKLVALEGYARES